MKKVERHVIKPYNKFWKEADSLCFLSKNIYNRVNYNIRQSFFYGCGIPTYNQLCNWFKDTHTYKALPAKVSQLVIKQVTDAWSSYLKAIFEYKINKASFTGKPMIPGYKDVEKGRNILKYNNQAISKASLASGYVKLSGTNIIIPTKKAKKSNLIEARIIPKKAGYYIIEVVYDSVSDEGKNKKNNSLVAAVDLGLSNLATIAFNIPGSQPIVINGRPIKSINRRWNKEVDRPKLSGINCRKQLPSGQFSSKRINNITRKRNCAIQTYMHGASREVVNQLKKHNIGILVIGKNKQWKTSVNLGKRNNQNFVSIPYESFINQLKYKCEEVGIEVIIAEESYTSQASFLDWDKIPTYDFNQKTKPKFSGERITRAWYKSADGTIIHADVNAAFNIGRKVIPTAFTSTKEMLARDRGCLVVHPRRLTPNADKVFLYG